MYISHCMKRVEDISPSSLRQISMKHKEKVSLFILSLFINLGIVGLVHGLPVFDMMTGSLNHLGNPNHVNNKQTTHPASSSSLRRNAYSSPTLQRLSSNHPQQKSQPSTVQQQYSSQSQPQQIRKSHSEPNFQKPSSSSSPFPKLLLSSPFKKNRQNPSSSSSTSVSTNNTSNTLSPVTVKPQNQSLLTDYNWDDRLVKEDIIQELIRYTEFSSAAYCMDENKAVRLANGKIYPISKFFVNSKTSISGYTVVDHERKEILATFRGTAVAENWFLNLQFSKSASCCTNHIGEKHVGFIEAYRSIQEQVKESVLELIQQNPDYHVAFLGHSLGGALATLAIGDAFSVSSDGTGYIEFKDPSFTKSKATLFTVGAPRVGDYSFAKGFAEAEFKASYRLVKNRDIVAHLPPTQLGYRHSPKEYWITPDGQVVYCDDDDFELNQGEDTNCANMYAGKPHLWSIPEHQEYFNIILNTDSDKCIPL